MRRLFNMLVNNVREHFMIYPGALAAAGDHRSRLVMVFLTAPGRGSRVWYSAGHGIY